MKDARAFYARTATAIADYLAQELSIRPGVHYFLRNAVNGPRVITLYLTVNPRFASKITSLAEPLSMAAGLDRDAHIRVSRASGGALALEIPKPRALWYDIPAAALPMRRGLRATVGLDTEHRPTLLDYTDPLTPHTLIAGATGCGKTNAERLIVYNLALANAPEEVGFLLIDTRKRGAGWRPFKALPHLLYPIITDDRVALRALAWAVTEVGRRAEGGSSTKPQIFVGLDEAQTLLEREEFVRLIGNLAATGREFGIHLIVATQNPTARQLGSADIKRNFSARLVGRVDSPDASRVAAGVGGAGAERLAGPGDFLLVRPGGILRLAVALLTEKDLGRLPGTKVEPKLNLEAYRDVDRVLDAVAGVRRQADPAPDPAPLAYALAYPKASQRQMYERFRIGFPRIRQIQALAEAVLEELHHLGFAVCPSSPSAGVGVGGGRLTADPR